MIFIFGLVTGVALMAIFGGGMSFGGGGDKVVRTFDTGDEGDAGSEGGSAGTTLAPVEAGEHILGDIENAEVVIVEYSDFECPFCTRHHPTIEQLMEEYDGQIAWVYRHFPLSFHANATPAAVASECAADQGLFWEYSKALFERPGDLNEELYLSIAGDLGIGGDQFENCLAANDYEADVNEDMASGAAAGVGGTPATFVNGELVSGAVPYATLDAMVQAILGS